MISKPYWTAQQVEIFEHCFEEIRTHNLTTISFKQAAFGKYSEKEVEKVFDTEEKLLTELVRYWAWKETWEINEVLIQIKNPFRRLFTLMKWGFKNNRYLKLHLHLIRMNLPKEAIDEMDQINRRKHDFLTELFRDRGVAEELAKIKAQSILPFYYGWAKDKEDQIKSDVHKFAILSIYKTMLFPEIFGKEKASVNDL